MSRQIDALLAGVAALAADKADDATASALRDRHDAAIALAQLDVPLEDPAKVYHSKQIECRRDKESGEPVFARALGTTENLARLVDAYGVQIRYNELSRDIEVSVAGRLRDGELARNTNLALVEDLCRINNYPHTQAAGNIQAVAERSAYNPAIDWIRSTPWDGKTRFETLFECLTLTDPSKAQISWTLFCKWLRGAAAILCGRASKFEHVLVLVDPTGGIGKTRFFNTLCPPAFQADGVALNVNDKDSILHVVSKWLVELGEIGATFSKSDTEALKAFLSRSFDEVRPPYARAANQYPRRTAFFGSVNNVRFLMDDTNNRRFWPIEVSAVDYQHGIDMQQVWAEALHQVEAGERWHLNPDENRAVGEYNEGFRSMDRVEELILASYDKDALPSRYLSATDVLEEVGVQHPKQTDTRRASALLRKLFGHKVAKGYTVYHLPYARKRANHLSRVPDRYADSPL
ncbi:VapE domain-containing protein [Luteimonas sp. A482]